VEHEEIRKLYDLGKLKVAVEALSEVKTLADKLRCSIHPRRKVVAISGDRKMCSDCLKGLIDGEETSDVRRLIGPGSITDTGSLSTDITKLLGKDGRVDTGE
jgi:hypothetical protein